jgi:enoyl reductase-like protein
LEPSGKDDLIIAQAADTKKLYFKALDTMERDQWLKALIDERAKAPIMYV